jgi:hypothetical protein
MLLLLVHGQAVLRQAGRVLLLEVHWEWNNANDGKLLHCCIWLALGVTSNTVQHVHVWARPLLPPAHR